MPVGYEVFKARLKKENDFIDELAKCEIYEAVHYCDECQAQDLERAFICDKSYLCVNCAADMAEIPRGRIPESLREE